MKALNKIMKEIYSKDKDSIQNLIRISFIILAIWMLLGLAMSLIYYNKSSILTISQQDFLYSDMKVKKTSN